MTEEMKPCPFCGKPPKSIQCPDGSFEIGCRHWNEDDSGELWCAASPLVGVLDKKIAVEKWNGAYCWKEIEKLRAENEELKKELAVKYTMENIDKDVGALEAANAKLISFIQNVSRHDEDRCLSSGGCYCLDGFTEEAEKILAQEGKHE